MNTDHGVRGLFYSENIIGGQTIMLKTNKSFEHHLHKLDGMA